MADKRYTSNVYSLPEVAGDAAVLVDPHSAQEIAGALLQLCTEPDTADRLRQEGLLRARTFAWQDCAERVADVGSNTLFQRVNDMRRFLPFASRQTRRERCLGRVAEDHMLFDCTKLK